MGMTRFGLLFREIAERETRTARVSGALSPDDELSSRRRIWLR